MDASRFDRLSKLFAERRARRAAARAATPEAPAQPGRAPGMLFVQTFRAGAVAPKAGAAGRYTLSLEAGDGQTIYFSDRPDRLVGAEPTGEFLDRLGFPADNPPNAALVFEAEPGNLDVAVVELFSPVYDESGGGVTYEVAPLANWQAELGVELQEAPTDLAAIASSFGPAHLFIDGFLDCPDGKIVCQEIRTGEIRGTIPGEWFDNFCSRSLNTVSESGKVSVAGFCVPCTTPNSVIGDGRDNLGQISSVSAFWAKRCNEMFPACRDCRPSGYCKPDPVYPTLCPPGRL